MDPAYSITSEPQPEPEKSTSDRVRELFGQSMGYLATAADTGLLGAPSFVARKLGVGDALEKLKALNPKKYKESAEWAGNISSMALPAGIPSKLAAGTAKLGAKVFPKAAPMLTSKAAQILANSESLAKLRGLRGMATRGAVNAAWTAAPREAMSENPEWGNVPLEATMGAVTGPVIGKISGGVFEKTAKLKELLQNLFPAAQINVNNNIGKAGKSSYLNFRMPTQGNKFIDFDIRSSDHGTGVSRTADYLEHLHPETDYDPSNLVNMITEKLNRPVEPEKILSKAIPQEAIDLIPSYIRKSGKYDNLTENQWTELVRRLPSNFAAMSKAQKIDIIGKMHPSELPLEGAWVKGVYKLDDLSD